MNRVLIYPLALLGVFFAWSGALCGEEPGAENATQSEFFERRIRPLLIDRCLRCHGPDRQEGELRLDRGEGLRRGGTRGPAIDAEDPSKSLLLLAVGREGELKMPPDEPLSRMELQQLTRWIERGAVWPQKQQLTSSEGENHWAFQSVERPEVQQRGQSDWSRNALDYFVERRLRQAGLTPSEAADRRTLIRRLFLDVTGLPPSPSAVERFLADSHPAAYDNLVDWLLSQPAFGERWGRHWLDVARYADNKGYVFFEDRNYPWAYAYRDWVVEALNRDMPLDQFIVHQLASDRVEDGRQGDLRAMGFLTVGPHFMNNTHDIVDDRIDVITRGFMGLTVTCARCHDHKYDPIPTADYYALYGVLRSSHEPLVPPMFAEPPDTEEYRAFASGMAEREKNLGDYIRQKHTDLVVDARTRIAEYLMAAYGRRNQPPTDDFMLLTDTDAINPTMVLRYQVYLEEHQRADDPVWSAWHRYAALPEDQFPEQAKRTWESLFGPQGSGLPGLNPLVSQFLSKGPPATMQHVAEAYAGALTEVERRWQELSADRNEVSADELLDPDQLQLHLELHGPRAPSNIPLVFGWGLLALFPDRGTQGELKKRLKEVETWSVTTAGAPPRAMTLAENEHPHQARVFLRGNPHRLGPDVAPRFLSLLPGEPHDLGGHGSRLRLGQAITAKENPLTARVMVNRIWVKYFGQGLVRTPSDFGLRSDPPSHPQLLDYLASELRREGVDDGSLKSVHRLILTSATYRQASFDRDECIARDPQNRLLWKMNRLRLEYEVLRDTLLAVSGDIELEMGGPPEQQLVAGWNGRRSIYGFIDRMDPAPLLTTFDVPNPVASTAQRSETTVAPQALYLMNHPFVHEVASRVMARKDVHSQATVSDRIRFLFQLVLLRPPVEEELELAAEFLGESPDVVRWQRYVHMLLMTNEFAFRD